MKPYLFAAAITAVFTAPAYAADVGVSVSIGQPGFYGQLDIGDYPRPQVMYRQPMIIERGPVSRPPVYMRVPPGHAKHWSKHCGDYNACGERVYFVQDGWYNREYAPRYREQHRDRNHDGRDGHRGGHGNDRRGDDGHGRNR